MKTRTIEQTTRSLVTVAAAAALLGAGCGSEADLDLGCTEQPSMTYNGMSYILHNGILYNGVKMNGAPLSAMEVEAGSVCRSDLGVQFLEYLVGCALSDEQEVTIQVGGAERRFRGQLGLAPEWAEQPCDETCQGWVSACLIARTNARGERVEISMRGDHDALALGRGEALAFPLEEAAYYGDLFSDPPVVTACLPDGNTELDRVCGELEDCPVESAGACKDVCDESGCLDASGERHAEVVRIFRDSL